MNMPQPQSLANEMLPRLFTIQATTWETGEGNVFTWELTADDGNGLHFKPGQFNMLYCPGVGEVPISISGDSSITSTLTHTTRAVGGVTKAMQQLRKGDQIGVRGPFGTAWPVEKALGKDLIIMAGGLGLAPVRPIVYYALNHRDKFNRVHLLYGTRHPLDILYRGEIEAWQHEGLINVEVTVDRAPATWHGDVGVATKLLSKKNTQFDPDNTVAMVCGPEIMMSFSDRELQKLGVSAANIYVSLERNMKCAIGHCGHCQMGPHFICKNGPVFSVEAVDKIMQVKQL